jgi:hypothetical protein
LQCCFVYAGVISDFASNYSVPVWIDQWGLRASAVGGDATQNQYMTDILAEFTERKFHWTYWCAKRTPPPAFCKFQTGVLLLRTSSEV